MEVKVIEVQDRATCIAALAIRPGLDASAVDPYQMKFLLGKAGFQILHRENCILFGRLEGGKFTTDPYEWGDRTMQTAHLFIEKHWDALANGSIVDVRVILGESSGGSPRSDAYYLGREPLTVRAQEGLSDGRE